MSYTMSEKTAHSASTYGSCQQLDQSHEHHDSERGLNMRRLERSYHLALFIALASFSAFGFIAGMAGNRYWTMDSAKFCAQEVSRYSPLLEDMDIEHRVVRFTNSDERESAFRKSAGPDVDAAWGSLGVDYRSVVVPSELAARSGLRPGQVDQVKVSEQYGGGYLANVEGLQHLSCLNLIRQSLYYNVDYYRTQGNGAFQHDEEVLRNQVAQCLDTLRQQLMCTVDIGVQGQTWSKDSSTQLSTNSNTQHKCRNFDAVRDWAEKHQVPEEMPADYLQKRQTFQKMSRDDSQTPKSKIELSDFLEGSELVDYLI